MHAILTPWAPVGPKTFLRLFGQKQKAVTAYIFINMYNANVHCTYQMKQITLTHQILDRSTFSGFQWQFKEVKNVLEYIHIQCFDKKYLSYLVCHVSNSLKMSLQESSSDEEADVDYNRQVRSRVYENK